MAHSVQMSKEYDKYARVTLYPKVRAQMELIRGKLDFPVSLNFLANKLIAAGLSTKLDWGTNRKAK